MSTHQYYELNEVSNSDYYSLQNTTAHPYEKYFRAKISDYSWKKFLLLIYQRFLSSIVASFLMSLFIVANAIAIVICEVVIYPKNNNFNHDIPRGLLCSSLCVAILLYLVISFTCDTIQFLKNKRMENIGTVYEGLKNSSPSISFHIKCYSNFSDSWSDSNGEHTQSHKELVDERKQHLSYHTCTDWTKYPK